jgi:Uma2 family endonuclease
MRLNLPYAPETPDFVDTPEGRKYVPEHMTLAEFMAFPFDEKDHWELIGGCPVMSPAPTYLHQRLLLAIQAFLSDFLPEGGEYELAYDVDILMPGQSDYLRPDIVVVKGREVPESGAMPLALVPRLVVEALSPSTGGRDIGVKREIYANGGVQEYWIADPATGAVSIRVNPRSGNYSEQPADEDGFVESPFVGKLIRVQRSGRNYRVLTR